MSVKSTESKLQWNQIGSEASRYLGHVATSTTMLGPLGDPSTSQAIRQVRQRAKRRKLGEVVHAEEVAFALQFFKRVLVWPLYYDSLTSR